MFEYIELELEHTQENIRNTQLWLLFLSVPLVCQNISTCPKFNRLRLAIIHLLDRAKSDIRFVVQIEADVGRSELYYGQPIQKVPNAARHSFSNE